MPIYEYEPTEHDCLICDNRFSVIQELGEAPLEFCPTCGMPCKRVISRAAFKLSSGLGPDRAAEKGFTTWRRTQKGVWEKVAGVGVDVIQGSPEDLAAIETERKAATKLDLDEG